MADTIKITYPGKSVPPSEQEHIKAYVLERFKLLGLQRNQGISIQIVVTKNK